MLKLDRCKRSYFLFVILLGVIGFSDSLLYGAQNDSPLIAFTGAQVIPVSSEELSPGILLIQGKKIIAVGTPDQVTIPAGTQVIDASGKVIMPGLICTHSHIGGDGGGDRSEPIQPETRILDAINVRNSGFRRAQAGGLTTLNIMPGSGHLISGQTVYVKLRKANTIDDLLIFEPDGNMMGGLKMANGLTFTQALGTITIEAARILGIDDRVGSLEVGKDGDLALYDGDPFEYTTHCVGVIIEGNILSGEMDEAEG